MLQRFHKAGSLVPRPHPLTRKRVYVTIEHFLGCAESVGSGDETTNLDESVYV